MSLTLAIVGRPNVGKSALFNRICGKRIAIVDEQEGVTRDRLYATTEFFGRSITVIDTGGIDPRSTSCFNPEVKAQAERAIEEADGLVLVVDGEIGPTDLDLELARLLHQAGKPLVLAINKIDSRERSELQHHFHPLGIEKMFGVSAIHGRQVAELVGGLLDQLPGEQEAQESQETIRVAILGRPNVGKSTLLNALTGEDRSIVSPVPGTTRDAIDAYLDHGNHRLLFLDTAGIRRKGSEHEVVDKFAAIRTEQAIKRSDVCILMCDAREGVTAFEKHIAAHIEEEGKACVLMLNKWDLVKDCRMEHAAKAILDENAFLAHCPLILGSAKQHRNLGRVLEAVAEVWMVGHQKFGTGKLNQFLERTMQLLHPPMINGKRLRVYYMTQVGNFPFRFTLFVNTPRLMERSYRRYIHNQLRKAFNCSGNPVVFQLRGKKRDRTRSNAALRSRVSG